MTYMYMPTLHFGFAILIKQENRPVLRKLKYLRNVNEPQLTKVAQHLVAGLEC